MEKSICLITGATEGVGNFTALQLAKRGFTAGGRAFMGLRADDPRHAVVRVRR